MVDSEVPREYFKSAKYGRLIGEVNSPNLVLIPKKKGPMKVADYRPITLCDIIYKIVTTTLTNKLKLVSPDLIDLLESKRICSRSINYK